MYIIAIKTQTHDIRIMLVDEMEARKLFEYEKIRKVHLQVSFWHGKTMLEETKPKDMKYA